MPILAELLRFLGGTLILLIPGICLARILSLGKSRLEILTTGSTLGLAIAVYLASALSHLDLRAFYPAWTILALICIAIWIKFPKPPLAKIGRSTQIAIAFIP